MRFVVLVLALLVAPGVGVKLRGVAAPAGEKDATKLMVAGAEPKKAEKKEEKKVEKKDEKKDAKKDDKKDDKKAKKKQGKCDEANALKKKVEKMEATDKKFFGKVMELKDLASACRAEKGKAAQKKADKKYEKKELGKANAMPKEHDPDTKKGQLNGTAIAKTTKKVQKESKAIDKTGFEGGKKAKGDKKKDSKKGDKKKEEKKKAFLQVVGEPKKEEKKAKKEDEKKAKKGEKDGKKNEKKDKKKDGKCGEASALSKKIGKMEATDKKFFGEVMKLKDLAAACRAEKGEAAQKKAEKKYNKKDLSKPLKEHDFDTKEGQLNGTAVAKTEKKVKAQTKEIDSAGFEGGKKGKGDKKKAGKKGDKKGEKKEEKKKAKKFLLVQTSACLTQDLMHRAQLQNKLAGVCVDMCKEVGAFPKCTCPDFVAPDSTPGVMTWPELLEHLDNLSEWGHGQLKAWTKQASQLQIEGMQNEKACLADDLKHRVQVQNKLAGVCVDMCKEVGAFPKCTCPDFVAPDSTPGVMTWPELLEHMDNLSEWGHGELKAWTNVAR